MPKIMINNKPVNVNSTTYMTGATAIAKGVAGMVPEPKAGDQNKVLKGNGVWSEAVDVIEIGTGTSGTLTTAQLNVLKSDKTAIVRRGAVDLHYVVGQDSTKLLSYSCTGVTGDYFTWNVSVNTDTGEWNYSYVNSADINLKPITIATSYLDNLNIKAFRRGRQVIVQGYARASTTINVNTIIVSGLPTGGGETWFMMAAGQGYYGNKLTGGTIQTRGATIAAGAWLGFNFTYIAD